MKDLSKYEQIIVWGAAFSTECETGDATSHGYAADKLYKLLDENGYAEKLLFFADSNIKLYSKKRLGLEVKPPAEILHYPKALIIINSLSMKAILKSMDQLNIKNECLIIPYYYYHGVLGNPYNNIAAQKHIYAYRDRILQFFNLSDKQTKKYLDIIINLREKGCDDLYDRDFYSGTGESQGYFCDSNLAPAGDVTFIDVGAFQGESIDMIKLFYGDRLKKCIAFEPDSRSMQELKKYISVNQLDKITIIFPYALGAEDKIIRFLESGSTSQQSETGGVEVKQKAFDHLQNIVVVGDVMVKMDIEGGELEALKGMKKFIKTVQPYLAICLYHKEEDLYEIPNYIKSICPDYQLYIRGGWHLECWAVPSRHFSEEEVRN